MAQLIEAGDASGTKPPRMPWPQPKKISRHSLMNRQLTSPANTCKETRDKKDGCIKVVLKPAMKEPTHA